jgi:hypothetical protein
MFSAVRSALTAKLKLFALGKQSKINSLNFLFLNIDFFQATMMKKELEKAILDPRKTPL